jgi:hypothetical protein
MGGYLYPVPLQTLYLARRLAVRRTILIHTSSGIAKAFSYHLLAQSFRCRQNRARLTNSNHLQAVVLGPVNQPRRKRIHRPSICLMHQWNVPIPTRTSLLKLLLTLLRRLVVPVTAVNIIGYHAVAEGPHGGKHVAARGEVRRAHVRGLLADDVDEGLLEARHLRGQVGGGEGAEI